MPFYTLYKVIAYRIREGQSKEAMEWFTSRGREAMAQLPGVRSVQAFSIQYGLGGIPDLVEVWVEIQDYGVFDRWDEDVVLNPERYSALVEAQQYLQPLGVRIMGTWPEADLRRRAEVEGE